jgi:hypothetical protein
VYFDIPVVKLSITTSLLITLLNRVMDTGSTREGEKPTMTSSDKLCEMCSLMFATEENQVALMSEEGYEHNDWKTLNESVALGCSFCIQLRKHISAEDFQDNSDLFLKAKLLKEKLKDEPIEELELDEECEKDSSDEREFEEELGKPKLPDDILNIRSLVVEKFPHLVSHHPCVHNSWSVISL